jgi:hypothetical protein
MDIALLVDGPGAAAGSTADRVNWDPPSPPRRGSDSVCSGEADTSLGQIQKWNEAGHGRGSGMPSPTPSFERGSKGALGDLLLVQAVHTAPEPARASGYHQMGSWSTYSGARVAGPGVQAGAPFQAHPSPVEPQEHALFSYWQGCHPQQQYGYSQQHGQYQGQGYGRGGYQQSAAIAVHPPPLRQQPNPCGYQSHQQPAQSQASHYRPPSPRKHHPREPPRPPSPTPSTSSEKTDRPHSCSRCASCFRTSSQLARHLSTVHSSKRNYQCRVKGGCGAVFKRSDNCGVHERTCKGTGVGRRGRRATFERGGGAVDEDEG